MGLFLQRESVFNLAIGGASREIDRSRGGQGYVDCAAVRGENIVAAAGAITLIFDIATGCAYGNALPGDIFELDRATGGLNIDAAHSDILQADGGRHAAHV